MPSLVRVWFGTGVRNKSDTSAETWFELVIRTCKVSLPGVFTGLRGPSFACAPGHVCVAVQALHARNVVERNPSGKTLSGKTLSGKTLSGRPTHAGKQHGFKVSEHHPLAYASALADS